METGGNGGVMKRNQPGEAAMAEMTRRRFFGKAIAEIAGFIALVLSVPILGVYYPPFVPETGGVLVGGGPGGKIVDPSAERI